MFKKNSINSIDYSQEYAFTAFHKSEENLEKQDIKIMSRLTQLVTEQGYHYFDWNDSGEDAGNTHSADEVYDNMIENLSEERINVVLCHDNGNTKLLDALPRFIDICLENGYTFSIGVFGLIDKPALAPHSWIKSMILKTSESFLHAS